MKEYNTKLTFKQVMEYFVPAVALFALLIVSNLALSAGGSLAVFGAISLVFNGLVIAKNVLNLVKKDKSVEEKK